MNIFTLIASILLLNLSIVNAASVVTTSPSGKILFNSDKDGDFEIYAMNANGTKVVKLTINNKNDTNSRWSADGKKIAFVRDGKEIRIMDANGRNEKLLFKGDSVAFSPDGKRMAFSADGNIYIYDIATKKTVKKISADIYYGYNSEPDWSPNGKTIVYTNKFLYSFPHVTNIAKFYADGASNNKRLTQYSDSDERYASQPRWSPNGKEILFTIHYLSGVDFLAHMSANGQNQKSLIEPKGGALFSPVWSPDGNYLLASYQSPNAKARILRASKDASVAIWLTRDTYNSYSTDWKDLK